MACVTWLYSVERVDETGVPWRWGVPVAVNEMGEVDIMSIHVDNMVAMTALTIDQQDDGLNEAPDEVDPPGGLIVEGQPSTTRRASQDEWVGWMDREHDVLRPPHD
jgi:hypothetical protein